MDVRETELRELRKSRLVSRCLLFGVAIAAYFVGIGIWIVSTGGKYQYAVSGARDEQKRERALRHLNRRDKPRDADWDGRKPRDADRDGRKPTYADRLEDGHDKPIDADRSADDWLRKSKHVAEYYETEFIETDQWFANSMHSRLPYVCQTATTSTACPSEYWRGPRFGNCYRVMQRRLEYTAAKASCARMGGHLATPQSKDEMQAVRVVCGPVQMCWLGIYQKPNSTTWVYVDDEREVSLNGWHPDSNNVSRILVNTAVSVGMFFTVLQQPNSWKPDWHLSSVNFELPSICERTSPDCLKNWVGPWGGSCYQVQYKHRSQPHAHAACAAMGGHLAFITSEDENQKVHELCGTFQSCWIGARYTGRWEWFNGDEVTYSNWAQDVQAKSGSDLGAFMSSDLTWWKRYVKLNDDSSDENWHWVGRFISLLFTCTNFFVQLIGWLFARIATFKREGNFLAVTVCLDLFMGSFITATVIFCVGLAREAWYVSTGLLGQALTIVNFSLLSANAFVLFFASTKAIELWFLMKVKPVRTVLHVRSPREGQTMRLGKDSDVSFRSNGNNDATVVGVPMNEVAFGGPVSIPPVPSLPGKQWDI